MPVETAAPSAPPATHPADENATSEVSGWLQEHGHPELAETFAKVGYKSLADLTPDAIRKTLSAQPPGVGDRDRQGDSRAEGAAPGAGKSVCRFAGGGLNKLTAPAVTGAVCFG